MQTTVKTHDGRTIDGILDMTAKGRMCVTFEAGRFQMAFDGELWMVDDRAGGARFADSAEEAVQIILDTLDAEARPKAKANSRPLGKTQAALMESLTHHGYWRRGCGWVWDTESGTLRILDSLVKRGLVTRTDETKDGYYGQYQVTTYRPAK